jgi:hypothetical protein
VIRPLFRLIFVLFAALAALPGAANAIPAFARQTSLPCSSCHVGAFGPQLTGTGRMFKANGYTMGQTKALYQNLAAMLQGGDEHTSAPTPPADHVRNNDNLTVDQVSLFYGGRVVGNVGLFSQVTYDGNARTIALDNTDLRAAGAGTFLGKSLIYGVTLNNNPSVQDLWQTTPAWGYPYIASALAPAPASDSYMAGLGGQVIGIGGYTLWNNLIYAEYTRYATIPDRVQKTIGNGDVSGNDHLKGGAGYWRVAVQRDFGLHYIEVGGYGFDARRYPGNQRDQGADMLLDAAIDGTWQYTAASGKYVISAYASALHERQSLDASLALGAAVNPRDHLDVVRGNLSYNYDATYGVTVGRFSIRGNADPLLYAGPSGRPDSSGFVTQFDYTPFGKGGAPADHPELNIRLFVQVTTYDRFDGARTNYDGTGRNASDNNTVFTGLWLAY